MCSDAVRSPSWWSALRLTSAATLLALSSACGGHFVVRGTDLYQEGRYVEAAEVFEQTEQRLASSPDAERARFGLYRGATFLKLGDVPHAARWLGYSRSILSRDPRALSQRDAALLDSSLAAVGNVDDSAVPARKERSELATAPEPLSAEPATAQ